MNRNYLTALALLFSAFTAMAQQKLDVQGHRGARALMPENTIPAMKYAVDLGVKTLELDCVISADGKVVVSHDPYMSSDFMSMPDGSTIKKEDEKSLLLYKMTYDSIRRYDAGTKVHSGFPDQKKMKTYRPLLSELFDSVETYVRMKRLKPVYYNIEIKSAPQYDNVAHPAPEEFVKLVIDVIDSKKVGKRAVIQSFDLRPLQILHQKYPRQSLSFLIANKDSFAENIKKLGFNPQYISPYYTLVNEDFVKAAHETKVKVLPWTVNDEPTMKKMADLNVDGIISDNPDKLVSLFGSYQKK